MDRANFRPLRRRTPGNEEHEASHEETFYQVTGEKLGIHSDGCLLNAWSGLGCVSVWGVSERFEGPSREHDLRD